MEVAFEPYKKISFQSYLPYESVEEFANFIACGIPPNAIAQTRLFWANGVLFRWFNHPPAEAVVKETLNGHLILTTLNSRQCQNIRMKSESQLDH